MPRKMISVAFALALLVLTSGAVQAGPVAAQPEPVGFFEQLWTWAVSSVAPIFRKDTSQIDPNGLKLEVRPSNGSKVTSNGRAGLLKLAM
jgi:hypothetical protein